MNLKSEVRELLQSLLQVFARETSKDIVLNAMINQVEGMVDFSKDVDQATQSILKLFRGIVPEKRDNGFDNEPYCKSCRLSERFCKCEGHNQCRATMLERIEKSEMFNQGAGQIVQELKAELQAVKRENEELKAKAKLGNISYKEAIALKERVKLLELANKNANLVIGEEVNLKTELIGRVEELESKLDYPHKEIAKLQVQLDRVSVERVKETIVKISKGIGEFKNRGGMKPMKGKRKKKLKKKISGERSEQTLGHCLAEEEFGMDRENEKAAARFNASIDNQR